MMLALKRTLEGPTQEIEYYLRKEIFNEGVSRIGIMNYRSMDIVTNKFAYSNARSTDPIRTLRIICIQSRQYKNRLINHHSLK